MSSNDDIHKIIIHQAANAEKEFFNKISEVFESWQNVNNCNQEKITDNINRINDTITSNLTEQDNKIKELTNKFIKEIETIVFEAEIKNKEIKQNFKKDLFEELNKSVNDWKNVITNECDKFISNLNECNKTILLTPKLIKDNIKKMTDTIKNVQEQFNQTSNVLKQEIIPNIHNNQENLSKQINVVDDKLHKIVSNLSETTNNISKQQEKLIIELETNNNKFRKINKSQIIIIFLFIISILLNAGIFIYIYLNKLI